MVQLQAREHFRGREWGYLVLFRSRIFVKGFGHGAETRDLKIYGKFGRFRVWTFSFLETSTEVMNYFEIVKKSDAWLLFHLPFCRKWPASCHVFVKCSARQK